MTQTQTQSRHVPHPFPAKAQNSPQGFGIDAQQNIKLEPKLEFHCLKKVKPGIFR